MHLQGRCGTEWDPTCLQCTCVLPWLAQGSALYCTAHWGLNLARVTNGCLASTSWLAPSAMSLCFPGTNRQCDSYQLPNSMWIGYQTHQRRNEPNEPAIHIPEADSRAANWRASNNLWQNICGTNTWGSHIHDSASLLMAQGRGYAEKLLLPEMLLYLLVCDAIQTLNNS